MKNKKIKKILILILIFVIIILGGEVIKSRNQNPFSVNDLHKYADSIYEKCKSNAYPPVCFDEEIPRLMDAPSKLSMEDAFEVTKLVQSKDNRYIYCHVLAHKLSYKETSKDLSKWKEVVTRCPTTMCNNGCQHGALMRRFNSEYLNDSQIEEIKPDLENVCESRGKWNPVEIERSMCYHALGHLNMFVTNADINKSIKLCKEIGNKVDGRNYTQTCTEGVFMSVYQPLEPEDFKLVKDLTPKKEDVEKFCSQYKGEPYNACKRESWPLFFEEIKKPEGLVKFCSYTNDMEQQSNCYGTLENILTVILVIDNQMKLDNLQEFCMKLPLIHNASCFAHTAYRLVQIDPRYTKNALEVCKLAQDQLWGEECYRALTGFANSSFHKGTAEYVNYCNGFPDKWKDKCLKSSN